MLTSLKSFNAFAFGETAIDATFVKFRARPCSRCDISSLWLVVTSAPNGLLVLLAIAPVISRSFSTLWPTIVVALAIDGVDVSAMSSVTSVVNISDPVVSDSTVVDISGESVDDEIALSLDDAKIDSGSADAVESIDAGRFVEASDVLMAARNFKSFA